MIKYDWNICIEKNVNAISNVDISFNVTNFTRKIKFSFIVVLPQELGIKCKVNAAYVISLFIFQF